MIYLVPSDRPLLQALPYTGLLRVPSALRLRCTDKPWALDCEVYVGKFNEAKWLKALTRLEPYKANCLFVVAPDVMGDCVATRRQWEHYAPMLDGWPKAYVCQDGETTIPDNAQAVFIGGSTQFKESQEAIKLLEIAKERFLWRHVGRVNTGRRLRHFMGFVDSIDGTALMNGWRVNWPILSKELHAINLTQPLAANLGEKPAPNMEGE